MSEMGVGVSSPKTATSALISRLCFSRQTLGSENVKLIQLIKTNQLIKTGSGRININSKNYLLPRKFYGQIAFKKETQLSKIENP